MAKYIGGIAYSYEYDALLYEINQDLIEGLLGIDEVVYVVRDKPRQLADGVSYRPIIDYYQTDFLESLEYCDSPAEKKRILDQYECDREKFESLSVREAIAEMEEWNSIL